MGNQQVTVEEFVTLSLKENREPIFGENGSQKAPYPPYWPPPYRADNGGLYSKCYFGKVFQYPEIGAHFNEMMKGNAHYPKINFDEIDAPDSDVMNVIEQLREVRQFWVRSIEIQDLNIVTSIVINNFNKYQYQIQTYVKKNFGIFLEYFGIVKSSSPHYPFYFKDGKVPLTFLYPIVTTLLLFIVDHYTSPNAPFVNFKTGSAYANPDANLHDIPTLQEFRKEAEIITFEQGNFWTEMGNKYKDKKEVLEFWNKNAELVESIKRFRKALKEGFLYAPPGIDDYYFRDALVQFMKFKDGPISAFNFTFFKNFMENRYTSTKKIDRVVLLYFYLMIFALEKLMGPDFWEQPFAKPHQKIPLIDIKPIDLVAHGYFFRPVKAAWLTTAEWTLFGRSNNYINAVGFQPEKMNEFRRKVWSFIVKYPLRPLRVPPFNFSEWTRLTIGWRKAAEQQWDDYFEWVVANVFAEVNINWVEPGQQLLNAEGLPVWDKPPTDNFQGAPLFNSYPDYGLLTDVEERWFGPSFKYLIPWTIGADWIWGDDFWDFVNGAAKFIFKKVLDALKFIAEALPAVLPFLLLFAGVGAGVWYLTKSENKFYLEENKKK